MSTIREYVSVIQSRRRNHEYQTNGFTWDYTAATDEDVRDTTGVFQETIDGLSQVILKIILPKHRPQLRRQIAYLIGLRQRQAEAWERYIKDCEERTENVNQWLEANQQKESWATSN